MRRIVLLAIVMFAAVARAEDVYLCVPLNKLTITDGDLKGRPTTEPANFNPPDWVRPYAAIDSGDEAFVWSGQPYNQYAPTPAIEDLKLVVHHVAADKELSGELLFPPQNDTPAHQARFKFSAADFGSDRKTFLQGKQEYYRRLLDAALPGAAWFRFQERSTAKELGENEPNDATMQRTPEDALDDTFSLFNGNRAVSENLQLDRTFQAAPATQPADENVDMNSIVGITVDEMKWDDLIKDKHPKLDPLAAIIPFDQHAIFFPTFDAAAQLADAADKNGSIVLQNIESASQDSLVRQRYEKQLCLSLSKLGRLIGPALIDSLAMTGSDPYLRDGSDVAVIFQAKNVPALSELLKARIATGGGKAVSGSIGDVAYSGNVTEDRSVCSYCATVGNAVIVTNSLVQLQRIIDTHSGKTAALASLPEYVYFRDRYPLGDSSETALLVLSDATIRRWCGPKWRIADSRRIRAAATMSDYQAQHAAEIMQGKTPPANSPIYGSLDFMTPISELDITKVTQAEASAYGRWRNSYQQDWKGVFDPIACRFSLGENGKIGIDLSITPLIASSDYRQYISITEGAELKPTSGDPHADALAHLALAINHESPAFKSYGNLLQTVSGNLRIEPLAWIDSCAAIYADDDPFWADLAAAKDSDKFMEDNFSRLPVALYVESRSPMQLAAFLTAARAFIDQSAPNLTKWETLTHGDKQYVKITASGIADNHDLSIYYVTLPKALVISLNESVIQRAMDRLDGNPTSQPATQPIQPWLGKNLALRIQPKIAQILQQATHEELVAQAQERAWQNIPILNEWKRLLPDKDPILVQQELFHVQLQDPMNGQYVWNQYVWSDKWHTMESNVYGNPAEPKAGPAPEDALFQMHSDFGLTFQNKGLRARVEMQPDATAKNDTAKN